VAVLLLFAMTAVATVGQFGERVGWFAGGWRSVTRMRAAWAGLARGLVVSPPLRYWDNERGPVSTRLAQYVSACVPPSDRLAVLWFAPETYYYADRLMAIRHMVFSPGLASREEQQRTSDKLNRFAPPIVLAESTMSTYTRTVFPELIADLDRDYVQGASLDENGGYVVLVRRGRMATGTWGPNAWPCFAER
jgi:hypothetical protein